MYQKSYNDLDRGCRINTFYKSVTIFIHENYNKIEVWTKWNLRLHFFSKVKRKYN